MVDLSPRYVKKYHNEHVGNKSPGLSGTLIDSTYALGITNNMFRKNKFIYRRNDIFTTTLFVISNYKKRRTITATAKNFSSFKLRFSVLSFKIFIINKYFKNLNFRVRFKY